MKNEKGHEIVGHVKREEAYLYYVDGNGDVCKAVLKRGGGRKAKK